MGINAHRAFHREGVEDTYHAALKVDRDDDADMREAREAIRQALVDGFRDWQQHIDREELLEHAALASPSFAASATAALRPKFRMQGSWSYRTLNRTTHQPPQEIDLDDGVFLPVSFLTSGGRTHPAVASDAYFAAVEAMVAPLCEERGWTLAKPKPSCVRVELREGAHVDLALYAIPDQDFMVLVEKVEARASFAARVDEQAMFRDEVYPNLPADHIMLAHRHEGWKPSDPRKLEDWFQGAVNEHGQQLRRVCRYLKAWRDNRWEQCRLSSIALMACVVAAYERADAAFDPLRDDMALSTVAEGLASSLGANIANPVVDGQRLDEGWSDELRAEFVAAADELAAGMRLVLTGTRRNGASARLVDIFGPHMPDDPELLTVEAVPTILTTGMLREAGQDDVAQRAVKLGGDSRFG